jgi:hypothetical protein
MTEEWKDIGIGKYAISNFGNVRGKDGRRLLKGCFVGSGHMTVNIYDGTKSKSTYIHHMVAKHFITRPEDPDKKIIDHINGDKTNNHHTNLRWVTQMENANNRYDAREATPEILAQREKVREYRKQNPQKVKEYAQMYRENGGKNATMSKDRDKSRVALMKRQQEEEERQKIDAKKRWEEMTKTNIQ